MEFVVRHHSYWLQAKTKQWPQLCKNENADVVIVGGGIGGVLSSYFLSQQGKRVILLEKDRIACGAAGKNAGLVVEGTEIDLLEMIELLGKRNAIKAWKYTRQAKQELLNIIKKYHLSCDLEQAGSYYIACTTKQQQWLGKEKHIRTKNNIKCKITNPTNINCNTALVVDDFMMHPVKLLLALISKAERKGAKFYEQSSVVKIEEGVVVTKHGCVNAKTIIVARESSDPGTKKLLQSHIYLTQPLSHSLRGMLWECGKEYHFVRSIGDRLLIGHRPPFKHETHVDNRKKMILFLANMLRLPEEHLKIEYEWECKMLSTPLHLPKIACNKNIYRIYGYAGNGWTHGFMTAKAVADHIAGKPLPSLFTL